MTNKAGAISIVLVFGAALTIGSPRAQAQSATPSPESPVPTATPEPSASPVPAASPLPTAPATQYRFITKFPIAAPSLTQGDPPQISEVDFTDRELSPGAPMSVRILTSPNVSGVYAYVAGRELGPVPLAQPGRFEISGVLPALPFAIRGRTYAVQFEARTVDGRATRVEVSVSINR